MRIDVLVNCEPGVHTNIVEMRELPNSLAILHLKIEYLIITLTPWLMELEGSMPHSQGLSSNPYPEPNQPNSSY